MSVVENNISSCNLEEELSYHDKTSEYYWDAYVEAQKEAEKMLLKHKSHKETYRRLKRSILSVGNYA